MNIYDEVTMKIKFNWKSNSTVLFRKTEKLSKAARKASDN